MMLTENKGDRFSLWGLVFLAGYATCSVVDRVPELRQQVPQLQVQVHQEKVKAKVLEVKAKSLAVVAAKEHCEHEITLSLVAAGNGVNYKAPNCPPEIKAKVAADLVNKAGE